MKYKIYDNQLGKYRQDELIDWLYEKMLKGSTCECKEGYDVLDEKDNTYKCRVCKMLNNIDTVTDEDMINVLENDFDFKIEVIS